MSQAFVRSLRSTCLCLGRQIAQYYRSVFISGPWLGFKTPNMKDLTTCRPISLPHKSLTALHLTPSCPRKAIAWLCRSLESIVKPGYLPSVYAFVPCCSTAAEWHWRGNIPSLSLKRQIPSSLGRGPSSLTVTQGILTRSVLHEPYTLLFLPLSPSLPNFFPLKGLPPLHSTMVFLSSNSCLWALHLSHYLSPSFCEKWFLF